MAWVELSFTFQPLDPYRDILIAELSELGFGSFVEDEEGLKAYIEEKDFDVQIIRSLYIIRDPKLKIVHEHRTLEEKNWNAEWESEYEPIEIGEDVRVRASFHARSEVFAYDILIDPRMSFGTGHHATTRLMLVNTFSKDLNGLNVLDMGCGTAVIAILAKMKGAGSVSAVDIDDNCVRNSKENIALNHVEIDVQKGGVELISSMSFNIIFANINRNILLADMSEYASALNSEGTLVISGFYKEDIEVLTEKAKQCGMEFVAKAQEAEWCSVEFIKH